MSMVDDILFVKLDCKFLINCDEGKMFLLCVECIGLYFLFVVAFEKIIACYSA